LTLLFGSPDLLIRSHNTPKRSFQFFNLFNHPNFGSPDNNLTNALFGLSTQALATLAFNFPPTTSSTLGFSNWFATGSGARTILLFKIRSALWMLC
jgi:hypothetical protein